MFVKPALWAPRAVANASLVGLATGALLAVGHTPETSAAAAAPVAPPVITTTSPHVVPVAAHGTPTVVTRYRSY